MVKCDVLLLAASIFLTATTLAPTHTAGSSQQIEQAGPTRTESDTGSSIPIHRVILLMDPVKDLSDPLVISLHNKTLAEKVERKHKRSLPPAKLPGEISASPTFTLPGTLPGKPAVDPVESISAEQLTALADLYLSDHIKDRLTSRYRITVLDSKDVNAAIGALHLSLQQAADPDGAQKLCNRLEGDAVVVIGMPVLARKEGLTRDLVMRTEVRLAALREPNGGFTPIHKPRELPSHTSAGHSNRKFDFTVAGAAVANRSFMRAGYSANYAVLAEQAAVQAAALAMHTLSTGEEAPLMSAGTRIAIAPAYGPDRADMLVFSSSGRHTEIGAVRPLPTDLADMFRPELLPVIGTDAVDAGAAAAAMRRSSLSSSALWRDNSNPDVAAARNLGGRLKVQYLLLARVIDVEVAASPSSDGGNSVATIQRDPSQPLDARPWEREAHAEACGALVRVQDGAVIWTDRGDTTVTSREKVPPASRAVANRNIAMDAEKFALVDLKRHFALFRSQFEQ